jgi:alpha-L-fucosidase
MHHGKEKFTDFYLFSATIASNSQQHNFNKSYVKPAIHCPAKDRTVAGSKVWVVYALGNLQSMGWSWRVGAFAPEDEGWTQRRGPYAASYNGYVKAYENLQTTFNPVNFNPDKWASAAKDAGMKYVVFTTKHHDGFCMFDTKQTDYKITSSKTPFSTNARSNVTKEIFDAFRKDGFMTGHLFFKTRLAQP